MTMIKVKNADKLRKNIRHTFPHLNRGQLNHIDNALNNAIIRWNLSTYDEKAHDQLLGEMGTLAGFLTQHEAKNRLVKSILIRKINQGYFRVLRKY